MSQSIFDSSWSCEWVPSRDVGMPGVHGGAPGWWPTAGNCEKSGDKYEDLTLVSSCMESGIDMIGRSFNCMHTLGKLPGNFAEILNKLDDLDSKLEYY